MGLGSRTFVAAGWQFLSVFLQAILQLIVLGVLAHKLSPVEFGIVATANIVLMFATVLSQGSIRPAIIQNKAITDNYIRVSFTFSCVLGIFFTVGIWWFSEAIGGLFENQGVTAVLKIICISFFLNSLSIVSEALLEKELSFKLIMYANILSYVFGYALVGVTMALIGFGVWALVCAVISQSVIRAFLIFLFRPHNIIPLLTKKEGYLITRFAGGSMLLWFFNYIALQADNIIIAKWLGSASLGIYNMAFTAMDMPRRFLGSVVEKVLFPSLSSIQIERERFKNVAIKSFSALNLIMLPISIVLIVISPEIVEIVLGNKWLDVVSPLQVLLMQIPFRASVRVCDSMITAKGILYRNAIRKSIYALLVIILAWIGHYWGVEGVAVSVTISVLFNYLMALEIGLRTINASWPDYFRSLKPGIFLGLIVAVLSLTLAGFLRDMDLHSVIVVLCVVCSNFLIVIILFLKFPMIYGDVGFWVLMKLSECVPNNMKLKNMIKHIEKKIK